MFRFKVRYCKVQMARFVSGDLSEAARRRVGRYIGECEDCHQEYMRQRAFADRLERSLPALGAPAPGRLDELWTSLQTELRAPANQRLRHSDFASAHSLRFSYGFAMLAISISLLLPMLIGFHASLSPVDLPRLPQSVSTASTPNANQASKPIAIATAQPGARAAGLTLQNTPAPGL